MRSLRVIEIQSRVRQAHFMKKMKAENSTQVCMSTLMSYTRKNLASCNKFVNKLCSHCLSQVVNKFGTSC